MKELILEEEQIQHVWNPEVTTLPVIVQKHIDQWLNPIQRMERKKCVILALLGMKRDCEIIKKDVILKLNGPNKGEVIDKEFTFYKSVSEKTGTHG